MPSPRHPHSSPYDRGPGNDHYLSLDRVGIFLGIELGIFLGIELGIFLGIELGIFLGIELGS